jgi:hypothetical protein
MARGRGRRPLLVAIGLLAARLVAGAVPGTPPAERTNDEAVVLA